MKKLFFIFSFISCFTFLVSAQTSGWESGVVVSGGGFKPGGNFGFTSYTSEALWYASVGVYGRKFWKEKFGLELGAQYGSYIYRYRQNDIYFGNQVDPQQGNIIGKPSTVIHRNATQVFEIPIRFVFKKDWNKFSFGCFIGVVPAVITNASSYTRVYGYDPVAYTSRYKMNVANKFCLWTDVGLLFRANISEKFALDMRPFFKTGLSPRDNLFHVNTLGLSVTSVWKF